MFSVCRRTIVRQADATCSRAGRYSLIDTSLVDRIDCCIDSFDHDRKIDKKVGSVAE